MRLRCLIGMGVFLLCSFAARGESVHIVEKGETFAGICKHYHVPMAVVMDVNPDIDPKKLRYGQKIKIPEKKKTACKPETPKPRKQAVIHIVKRGDTLSNVARRYGLSIEKLREMNRLKSNVLHAGQRLIVKQGSSPSAKCETPTKSPAPQFVYITPRVKALIDSPKQIKHWKYIIVHHSGTPSGDAKIFDYYHRHIRGMENGLAYHFIIGNGTDSGDGEIEVGSRWLKQIKGGHVSDDDLNEVALGICLVGNFNEERPSPRQIASLIELINYLNSTIPGKHPEFTTHREAQPNHTECPGRLFPFQAMHKIFD